MNARAPEIPIHEIPDSWEKSPMELIVGYCSSHCLCDTAELIYQVKSSSDLARWSTLAGTEISVIPSATLPGGEDVVFRVDQAVSNEASLFVRPAVQLS